jgi:hypothetical protein
MTRWAIVGVAACLSAATALAQTTKDGGHTITLTSDTDTFVKESG